MLFNRSVMAADAATNPHEFPRIAKEMGFNFSLRRGRVDWYKIESINVDRLVQDCDLTTLQDNLLNIVNYNLDREYDVKILDQNFVKLFKLAQLSIDYLMYSEQHLFSCIELLQETNQKLKKDLDRKEEELKNLKKKFRVRKHASNHRGHGNEEYFQCTHCGKTFLNSSFLSSHSARRHPSCATFVSERPDSNKSELQRLRSEIDQLRNVLNVNERSQYNLVDHPTVSEEQEVNKIELDGLRSQIDQLKDGISNSDRLYRSVQINTQDDTRRIAEEWHEKLRTKYKEDVTSLKNMFYSEMQKMKEAKPEDSFVQEQHNRELLDQILRQESELRTIREQLREKPSAELEKLQGKMEAQDVFWKSSLREIEEKHRREIEDMKAQLDKQKTPANDSSRTIIQELIDRTTKQEEMLTTQSKQILQLSEKVITSASKPENQVSPKVTALTNPPAAIRKLVPSLRADSRGQSEQDVVSLILPETSVNRLEISAPVMFTTQNDEEEKEIQDIKALQSYDSNQNQSSESVSVTGTTKSQILVENNNLEAESVDSSDNSNDVKPTFVEYFPAKKVQETLKNKANKLSESETSDISVDAKSNKQNIPTVEKNDNKVGRKVTEPLKDTTFELSETETSDSSAGDETQAKKQDNGKSNGQKQDKNASNTSINNEDKLSETETSDSSAGDKTQAKKQDIERTNTNKQDTVKDSPITSKPTIPTIHVVRPETQKPSASIVVTKSPPQRKTVDDRIAPTRQVRKNSTGMYDELVRPAAVGSSNETTEDGSGESDVTVTEHSSAFPSSVDLALRSVLSLEEALKKNPQILQEFKVDMKGQLEKRLRELGVDPEWAGLPLVSFNRNMATLKHQQSITAKSCPPYFTIRQHIIDVIENSITQSRSKSSVANTNVKINKAFSGGDTQGQLNKFVGNVRQRYRGMVERARHEKNPVTAAATASQANAVTKRESRQPEQRRRKTKRMSGSQLKFTTSTPIKDKSAWTRTRNDTHTPSDDDVNNRIVERPPEVKAVTLHKNYNEVRVIKNDDNKVSSNDTVGQISLKTFPHKSLSKSENFLDVTFTQPRSALKGAVSTGSLITKKRVLFMDQDESDASPVRKSSVAAVAKRSRLPVGDPELGVVPLTDTDSDFELSSDTEEKMSTPKNNNQINLSTKQSDKIALISKDIELQLSRIRTKPPGGVETMFQATEASSSNKHQTDIPSANPRNATSSVPFTPASLKNSNNEFKSNEVPVPKPRQNTHAKNDPSPSSVDDWDLEDFDDILSDY